MIKFTVNANRQKEFKALSTCFNITVDKTKVKDDVLTGNDFSPSSGNTARTNGSQNIRCA